MLQVLERIKKPVPEALQNREVLDCVARTALRTKLPNELADLMTEAVVSSVQCIATPHMPVDLHMVEIMTIQNKLGSDSKFVRGLVLDHGARHPDMPKYLENCYIMTCNVSME